MKSHSVSLLDHIYVMRSAGRMPDAVAISPTGANVQAPYNAPESRPSGRSNELANILSFRYGAAIATGSVLLESTTGQTLAQCMQPRPANVGELPRSIPCGKNCRGAPALYGLKQLPQSGGRS